MLQRIYRKSVRWPYSNPSDRLQPSPDMAFCLIFLRSRSAIAFVSSKPCDSKGASDYYSEEVYTWALASFLPQTEL